MRSSTELFLFAGGLHLAALAVVGALVVMMFRADTTNEFRPPPDDDGDGRGGIEPHKPSRGPSVGGGPPLPTSLPARVRLREPGQLGKLLPRPERRPAREPGRPRRAPTRR
jgi:hypothetical protein